MSKRVKCETLYSTDGPKNWMHVTLVWDII